MNVFMINSGNVGCCYIRILLPAYANGFITDKKSVLSESIKDINILKLYLEKADIVVFHRPENEEYLNMIKILKKDGKKIVIDNDDTFKIADKHPLAQWTSYAHKVELENRDKYFDKCAKLADLITTTTKTLEKEYNEINNNVVILPNCVDPMDWDKPLKNRSNKVRIGMVGSVTYAYDYAHIKGLLNKLSARDDVQLVMFGLGDANHRNKNPEVTKYFQSEYDFWGSLNIEQIPWCPIEEYPTKLNEAKLDIMLIPRRENYFNKCKSNIKVLEASMCEIPCIVQSFQDAPYEEFTDGVNIIKVKDNKDWDEKVEKMIKDKKLRRKIGKNALNYTLKYYNIEDNAYKWASAYKKIYEKN